MQIMEQSLKDFVLSATEQLSKKITRIFSPLYSPDEQSPLAIRVRKHLASFSRKKPYNAQKDVVCALVKGFQKKRCLCLVGEMGSGKTLQGALVASALEVIDKHPARTLVLCPPHLVSTWEEEIQENFGDTARCVNIGGADALARLVQLRSGPLIPDRHEFWVIGFNRAKTGYRWVTRYFLQHKNGWLADSNGDKHLHRYHLPLCDRCSTVLPEDHDLAIRQCCPHCGSPLWGAEDRRFAPASYIKRYLRKHFHLLVCDEAHQLKAADSIQGAMLGQLASALPRTLLLTGTLSGGKASDIYYLLQRAIALNFSKKERMTLLPPFGEVADFVRSYGSLEEMRIHDPGDPLTGRASRNRYSLKEKPGISPQLLRQFFLEHCVFLRISDISDALPPYREELEYCEMSPELASAYADFAASLRIEAKKALKTRDMRVVGQMLSNLLAYPDMPQKGARVVNRENLVVASAPCLDIHRTPKDDRLVECVSAARQNGRKCLVFVEYTGTWQGDQHLQRLLADAGFRFLVLTSSVPTDKRLDWIRNHMKSGLYDGLICQPKLVETGLNLREFPEVLYYQTGYSTYVLRQASRRSWRPGQQHDVVVRFFINRNTMQETAMALIASKLEASLVLEGELSDKGLVALSDAGDSMGVELARALAGHLKVTSLDEQFKAYRTIEAVHASARPSSHSSPACITGSSVGSSSSQPVHVRRKVGELAGMFGGEMTGWLFGKKISGVQREMCVVRLNNRQGKTLGLLDTDSMRVQCLDGQYDVVVEPAFPGMMRFSIYQGAA